MSNYYYDIIFKFNILYCLIVITLRPTVYTDLPP